MSTVIATSVLPDSTANDTLTFGATGDSVAISGDSLNMNTLQDAGGNTIFVSNGSGLITSTGLPGAMKFISTTTVSSAVASIAFTSGLDSTYDVYVFKFINIVPVTDNVNFQFQFGTGGTPTYGVTKTSTNFAAYHNENDSAAALAYQTSGDLAESTSAQQITWGNTPNNDGSLSGEMHLFNPASTTYVKNWYMRTQQKSTNPRSQDQYVAGYANTTTALTAIQFTMTSGNIDGGTIAMYGISKS